MFLFSELSMQAPPFQMDLKLRPDADKSEDPNAAKTADEQTNQSRPLDRITQLSVICSNLALFKTNGREKVRSRHSPAQSPRAREPESPAGLSKLGPGLLGSL